MLSMKLLFNRQAVQADFSCSVVRSTIQMPSPGKTGRRGRGASGLRPQQGGVRGSLHVMEVAEKTL